MKVAQNSNDFHPQRLFYTIKIIAEKYSYDFPLKVLDVGCSFGTISNLIKNSFTKSNIIAIDKSQEAINYCKQNIEGIEFVLLDVDNFTYHDNYFDLILLNNVFEHLISPFTTLNKLSHYLNDGGIIIISTPNRFRLQNLLRAILGKDLGKSNEHITEFSLGQMKEIASYFGLNLKEIVYPKVSYKNKSLLWRIIYTSLQLFIDYYFKLMGSDYSSKPISFYVFEKKAI